MPFKGIIFDMDGVLVDSMQAWFHAQDYVVQHFGNKPLTVKHFLKHDWGARMTDFIREDLDIRDEATFAKVIDFYEKVFPMFLKHMQVFPHAEQTLRALRKLKFKLALQTSSERAFAVPMLKQAKLFGLFDAFVFGEETRKAKPDPEPILKACGALGLKPGECVYVGDLPVDVKAAKAAGCSSIIFGKRTAGAGVCVKKLSELPGAMKRLYSRKSQS